LTGGEPTTLVLVRHGVTDHTTGQRFSGGLAGSDPALSQEGRSQVRSVGAWLASATDRIDAVVTSPVRRTRESAEILAGPLGRDVEEEPGLAEMEFGAWDGLTFLEVSDRYGDDLQAWLGSVDVAPGGTGESFRAVEQRVLAALDRVLVTHLGRTVVVVSHVTPIKTLVAHALDAPLLSLFRMELAPASVTVLAFHPAGRPGPPALLRRLNAVAPDRGPLGDATHW
jgi:probable phosphoglycerate mutase